METLDYAPKCPTCALKMKPLWGAKWFCTRECDLPVEKRSVSANPIAPIKCRACGSHNIARFAGGARGYYYGCWDCACSWFDE